MPIGRRSGGGVRLRSVSGIHGEGGGVFPRGTETSGALVLVLKAAWSASFYGTPWRQHPVPCHFPPTYREGGLRNVGL